MDQNIIILPADKGGSTAILNKTDYKEKMLSLLDDRSTYQPLPTDPTKAQASSIDKVLKRLTGKKQLSEDIAKSLKQTEPTIAKIYGLPKVHKTEVPLRPIVSLIGAPNYKISKWLFQKLHPLTKNCETSIENSTEFLKKLQGITIFADEIMVSFDVVSLFTSIPLDVAKQCTEDLLLCYDTDVPAAAVLELIGLCLETNFSFDQQCYKQLKGAPMGSPISGFLAEITMQKLGATALPLCTPKLWLRYVDDTFVIVKKNQLEMLHNTINSTISGIQFTLEKEVDNKLPFLDVLVQRKVDGTLRTSVYRKETYAEVILPFKSNQPISHKRSAVNSLLSRAKTHCSDEEGYRAELNYLYELFSQNGYPKDFVRRCMRQRESREKEPGSSNQTPGLSTWRTLPYIKNVSELVERHLRKHQIRVAHKPTTTLRSQLVHPKDRVSQLNKKEVVYKIPCDACAAVYCGQTGKSASTRIHEHQLAVKRRDHLSQVAMHTLDTGHTFAWDKARVVAVCPLKKGREFLEAMHSDESCINRHIELDAAYRNLKEKWKRREPTSSG
ncbi:hypothetical protein SprV_0301356300 [Sparganum proliferum]